ncbi:MAG: hypothetical protein ACI4LX_03995 [Treponema sp.]
MKLKVKKNKTNVFFVLAAVFTAVIFSGCQDPIFWNIRQEVKLEEATIYGDIFSIVRFKDKLFIANGNIYSKDKNANSHGQWSKMNGPTGHVLTVAADENNIYALSITSRKNDSEGEMELESRKLYYSTDGNSWKEVSGITLSNTKTDVVKLLCTNSPQNAHRYAYIRNKDNVYKLNGAAADTTAVSGAGSALSCVYTGTVRFFTAEAACTDETESTAPTAIYYSSGSDLKRINADGSSEKTVVNGIRSTIYGIAVMKDSVLVTTAGGTALVARDSGTEIQFANLQSTLSTLYESRSCLAVDPSLNAHDCAVYAGLSVYDTGSNSALFTHEGLWSYYPARGKWNIE